MWVSLQAPHFLGKLSERAGGGVLFCGVFFPFFLSFFFFQEKHPALTPEPGSLQTEDQSPFAMCVVPLCSPVSPGCLDTVLREGFSIQW